MPRFTHCRSAAIAAIVLAGCDGRAQTPPPAAVQAPSSVALPKAPPADEPAPALAPEPAPAPSAVTFPDGTPAIACEASPPKMACIPGGPFVRGSDDGPDNARPKSTVWAQTFYMDLHEVTYDEYEACEREKKCDRGGPQYTDYNHPNMPITGVTWHQAVKYCAAHGKHLPTEAQWEKAARGEQGGLYPWGDEPVTCERAIIRDASGRGCGLKKQYSKPETSRPHDVGSRPAGVYGLFDMVGNSWEWVADWSSKSWADCGADCEGVDPKGPCGGAEPCKGHRNKVVRGGSWYWEAEKATGVYRRFHAPNNQPFHHFGFRCAASVEEARKLVEK